MPQMNGIDFLEKAKRTQNEVQTEDFSRNVWRGEKIIVILYPN